MTSNILNDENSIEKRIRKFTKRASISEIHKSLVKDVESKLTQLNYIVIPIGSAMKKTAIDGSDVDLLAILPENKSHFDPSTALNNLKQISSFTL